MTPPSLMQEAQSFMAAYRQRALRDVVTSVLMAVVFVLIAITTRVLWIQVGAALAALGGLVGVWWTIRSRPAPAPADADPITAYKRLLDDGIATAQSAALWTVLPLIPGTALVGFGLVAATLPLSQGSPLVIGLCVATALGLLVCWRLMWHTRSQHTAELMARREALNDELSAD